MSDPLTISIGQLFYFGLGACLLFVSIALLAKRRSQFGVLGSLFLVVASILMGQEFLHGLIQESLQLMIWPLFYHFVRQRHKEFSFNGLDLIHFLIPAAWVLVSFFQVQTIGLWFRTMAFVQFVPYALIILIELWRQLISTHLNSTLVPFYSSWMFYGFLIIVVSRLLLPFGVMDPNMIYDITWGLLGFYFLISASFFIRTPYQGTREIVGLEQEEGSNYEDEISRRLDMLLTGDRIFLIPDLSLQELAQKMQMRSSELSGFFNTILGRNFNDVINEHRVDEVKRLLRDPSTDPKATLMELAYQSGFNSKASFNRIFKKITGKTPKEFKSEL